MDVRQARKCTLWIIAILTSISACSPLNVPLSTPTHFPVPSATATETPLPAPTEKMPTPEICSDANGQVDVVAFAADAVPQFRIYLPPCYNADSDRYPVLYLLHGQGSTDEQWIRLGVPEIAAPYIIVMPFNRFSMRAVNDDPFGDVLVDELIPYIDENYRTLAQREYRAIGGLSRGGGWALRYGLTRSDLFRAVGLHAPAIFYGDASKLPKWLWEISPNERPKIYIDIGDNDPEHNLARDVADILTAHNVRHEWHLFTGTHNELYWNAHVDDYLLWYTRAFGD